MKAIFCKILEIFLVAVIPLLIFFVLFQLWGVDFTKPLFAYHGDALFNFFLAKSVIDQGWIFENSFVGLPHLTQSFYFYDFPLYSDSFHVLLLKFFSYFTANPFLAVNCFFVLTFSLISLSSFFVLRSFEISRFTSCLISVLYSFIPYHFFRNTSHLFLANYALIPLVVMVSLWISSGKVRLISVNEKEKFCLKANRFFVISLVIACFAAFNGVYYAFYSVMIFIFAWFLYGLRSGNFFDQNLVSTTTLSSAIFLVLSLLYIPVLTYWALNGMNDAVANRGVQESEFFALRIVDLLLPVYNHYFEYFRNLSESFYLSQPSGISERSGESLGILGSAGFLFLLLWLFAKVQTSDKSFLQRTIAKFSLTKTDKNLIADLSSLNLLVVLFATAGGFIMLIAMPFPLLRSHARFSIFIAFFSLFLIAILSDKIIEKRILGQKIFAQVFLLIIFSLAILDQVGVVSAQTIQSQSLKDKFVSDQDFVRTIEAKIPPQSKIFVLPFTNFPEGGSYESLIGYLHSQNLYWSQPAMNGRESSNWQKDVINLDFKSFISELKKKGFTAIYLDRAMFVGIYGWKELRKMYSHLQSIAAKPVLISSDHRLMFFEI